MRGTYYICLSFLGSVLVQFMATVYLTSHDHQVVDLSEKFQTRCCGKILRGRFHSYYTNIPSLKYPKADHIQ